MPRPTTTRFAPAPTGYLHLGHVASAVWVWGAARVLGARVLLRIEDHDRLRSRPEYDRALLDDLGWLGFEADGPPVRQSDREELYRDALSRLEEAGLVYVCDCTRRQIRARSDATGTEELHYPGTCRDRALPSDSCPIRRIRTERREVAFVDARLGPLSQVPSEQCGDLLARDRDGHWTYHFAVTVDDADQGVDLVVRGEDLLASTGRQIQLAGHLGRRAPATYLHHPLILRPDGEKLSKSAGDAGVRELRAGGWSPARVLGAAARATGLLRRERDLGIEDLPGLVEPHLGTLATDRARTGPRPG